MKHKITPLPEVIIAGDWNITRDASQPRVDIGARRMFIPTDHNAQSVNVRAHELAHVRWSPAKCPVRKDASPLAIQSVEDCRVNNLAVRYGVSFAAGFPQDLIDHAVQGVCITDNIRHAVYLLVCMMDYPSYQIDAARERLATAFPDDYETLLNIADTARRYLVSSIHYTTLGGRKTARLSFARTLRVAAWLDRKIASAEAEREARGDGDPIDARTHGETINADGLSSDWGTLREQVAQLVQPKRSRAKRVSDSGAVFTAPHRLHVDQKVFQYQLRAPRRGSVLVDASGSMHLDAAHVRTLAETLPAGLVAAYAGWSDHGVLRVLARHGRIAASDDAYEFPGMNVVDGPSLLWLSRQPAPRYWVSDGVVTGKGDHQSDATCKDRDRLLKSAGIVRVDSVDALARRLTARKR